MKTSYIVLGLAAVLSLVACATQNPPLTETEPLVQRVAEVRIYSKDYGNYISRYSYSNGELAQIVREERGDNSQGTEKIGTTTMDFHYDSRGRVNGLRVSGDKSSVELLNFDYQTNGSVAFQVVKREEGIIVGSYLRQYHLGILLFDENYLSRTNPKHRGFYEDYAYYLGVEKLFITLVSIGRDIDSNTQYYYASSLKYGKDRETYSISLNGAEEFVVELHFEPGKSRTKYEIVGIAPLYQDDLQDSGVKVY